MKMSELMTKDVMTVRPDATLKDVAAILAKHRISGLPVVDEHGSVLGVVSEADILLKETGSDEDKRGFLSWFRLDDLEAERKLEARTAGEAMTSPAITIMPRKRVHEAARKMTEHGVNRLPVLEHGKLVGIVTRNDLVRAFTRSDAQILHEIREDVIVRTLWISPERVRVTVENGEVALNGRVERKTDAELLTRFVERVAGVVSVKSDLRWVIGGEPAARRRRQIA